MFIVEIISQHRRDFWATFKCEYCGAEQKEKGYDDTHYHLFVIPKMQCKACLKSNHPSYTPRPTKYPDGMQL